jgi:monofunctional biosynthetic peptidoglycan transglycosylase
MIADFAAAPSGLRSRTMPAATQSRTLRRPLFRLAWAVVIAILFVVLLPYLLVPLYRVVNPVSTPMLWRWATGARVEHNFVPLERMAPALPVTVIASEDGRFCSHRGIDWREISERLEDADISEARGVSTITQQTAKNLFLWHGRSFVRKGLEFPLALWIDLVLPKRRVLEIYLNIAEWGPNGQYGAAGAGRAPARGHLRNAWRGSGRARVLCQNHQCIKAVAGGVERGCGPSLCRGDPL